MNLRDKTYLVISSSNQIGEYRTTECLTMVVNRVIGNGAKYLNRSGNGAMEAFGRVLQDGEVISFNYIGTMILKLLGIEFNSKAIGGNLLLVGSDGVGLSNAQILALNHLASIIRGNRGGALYEFVDVLTQEDARVLL